MIKFGRTNRSLLGQWWWTVDRWMLVGVLALMATGALLSLAASPAISIRLGVEPFYFVWRHFAFLIPAGLILFGASLLNVRQVRRLAGAVFVMSYILTLLTLWLGPEIKGATRWLDFGLLSLQPSEFLKPSFVVIAAWLYAEHSRGEGLHGHAIVVGLLALVVGALVFQPDVGQVMLLVAVWAGLFFTAGMSWVWMSALGLVATAGAISAYTYLPHVAYRVDRFLNPHGGDNFQVERALEAVTRGGFFGRGPGEGEVKRILPDAHSDFIFAVAAEEYGIIVCLFLLAIFGFVVLRGLMKSFEESDQFVQLASAGLVMLFGLQVLINVAVNVNLLPAKGMTLPFISYGGSSLLASGLTMGMLLALTRRRVGRSMQVTRAVWTPVSRSGEGFA